MTMSNPTANSMKETHSPLDWQRRAFFSGTGPDARAFALNPAIDRLRHSR
jgi:hypothetical protein